MVPVDRLFTVSTLNLSPDTKCDMRSNGVTDRDRQTGRKKGTSDRPLRVGSHVYERTVETFEDRRGPKT